MILKDVIRKAEGAKAFKDWKKESPDFYLAHAFTMLDERERKFSWELGYYSPKRDKLVVVETDPSVSIRPEEEIFKKGNTIHALDMKRLGVSVTRAMEICDELLKKKYPAQTITKRIILVQNLDLQMYNVTMVSQSFQILNIKIDASAGDVISDNLQSIMGLGDWQKGGREK
jgi:hypothetical protein